MFCFLLFFLILFIFIRKIKNPTIHDTIRNSIQFMGMDDLRYDSEFENYVTPMHTHACTRTCAPLSSLLYEASSTDHIYPIILIWLQYRYSSLCVLFYIVFAVSLFTVVGFMEGIIMLLSGQLFLIGGMWFVCQALILMVLSTWNLFCCYRLSLEAARNCTCRHWKLL